MNLFYGSTRLLNLFSLLVLLFNIGQTAFAQPDVKSWGNMDGIRVEGQLMKFHSSLVVVSEDWSNMIESYKEQQRPKYTRQGKDQIIESTLGNLDFKEVISESGKGSATVKIDFTAKIDTAIAGAFLKIELPFDDFLGGKIVADQENASPLTLEEFDVENNYKSYSANSVKLEGNQRSIQLDFKEHSKIYVSVFEQKGQRGMVVYVPVMEGQVISGNTYSLEVAISAKGEIDTKPILLTVDPEKQGRTFDGIGGNFRIQNPKLDPQVIQYCLDNLNVTWARVEMPWRFWHPDENVDPLSEARKGNVHQRVKAAMEMAKKVYDMGIPVILSDWSAPDWAIIGEYTPNPHSDGQWGNSLDQTKNQRIYTSISSYLIYLKEAYGVEVEMFSFNESDLGIYVKQAPEEHTRLIKELGAFLKSKGLKTKMLMGDTSDAYGYAFVDNAMNDPATKPYTGAISFHSWRGWEDETLKKWYLAAHKIDAPLIVGEGSIDASAWRVPQIFEEPSYALAEIDLYVRILQICQPRSILQWQLTADYSVLSGGGVFKNDSVPLHPTQRFWNLKQLGTPVGLKAWQVISDSPDISFAALGDLENEKCVIHLVNKGATREVVISGLPKNFKKLRLYRTNENSDMEMVQTVKVKKGKASFLADAVSFMTLIEE